MFAQKTPKLQESDRTAFTTYYPSDIDPEKRIWPDVLMVGSIDPGIRNLAVRIESRGFKDNHPIKTIVWEKLHIKDEERKLQNNVDNLYFLITNFLDQFLEYFKQCHLLIIERQLSKNYKAVRVSQHIISYFMFHFKNLYPNLPMIFEVDSKLKGKELGASKHLNERGLKQWAV